MLPAEGSIRKLHIIWCLDVIIRKAEGFIIPSIIGVLIPRSKVAQFSTLFGRLEHLPDEVIEALALEDDGDGDGKFQFRLPTNHSMHLYPISMSGRNEYAFYLISGGGGILNRTCSLWFDYCTSGFACSTIIYSCCSYYSEEKPSSIMRSSSLGGGPSFAYFCIFSIILLYMPSKEQ